MGDKHALGENKSNDGYSRLGEECKISVDEEDVEEVDKLKYLGVMMPKWR